MHVLACSASHTRTTVENYLLTLLCDVPAVFEAGFILLSGDVESNSGPSGGAAGREDRLGRLQNVIERVIKTMEKHQKEALAKLNILGTRIGELKTKGLQLETQVQEVTALKEKLNCV